MKSLNRGLYAPDLLEKSASALIGAALGDALGWPNEGRARRVQAPSGPELHFTQWTKRSGGRFQAYEEDIEPGSYSDDTQLILAVARARIYRDWWLQLARVELPFWTLYERGGGGASLRAARLLLRGQLPWEAPPADRQKYLQAGGNGAAMRVAPHCLAHVRADSFDPLASDVLADAVLTHGHPRALVGALGYAYALWLALRTSTKLEFGELIERVADSVNEWATLPSIQKMWPTWAEVVFREQVDFKTVWHRAVEELYDALLIARRALEHGALSNDEETLFELGCFDRSRNGSGTVSAAASIFLASKHAASPFEAVARAALARGADTDTIASMSGAIGGAISGLDWLAPHVKGLQDIDYIAICGGNLVQDRAAYSEPSKPLGRAWNVRLLAELRAGADRIELPIGGAASVRPHYGIRSRSERVEANSWSLRSDFGQHFFVKSIRNQGRPKSEAGLLDIASNRRDSPASPAAEWSASFTGVVLNVADLEKARRFYASSLRLPVTRVGANTINFGPSFALRQFAGTVPAAYRGTFYIAVDDVNACRQALDMQGCDVSELRELQGRAFFVCRDPDGNRLEVLQTNLAFRQAKDG